MPPWLKFRLSKAQMRAIANDPRVNRVIGEEYGIHAGSVGNIKRRAGKGRGPLQGEVKLIDGKRISSPEYRAWQQAKNRVCNPKAKDFRYYGGRGIRMDDRWFDSFAVFLADMGRRPSKLHTLDRIEVNGNYCKKNCRWATRRQQSQNRTDTRFSPDDVKKIRELYATGKYYQKDIALMYGSTQAAISQITRNAAWKPVE